MGGRGRRSVAPVALLCVGVGGTHACTGKAQKLSLCLNLREHSFPRVKTPKSTQLMTRPLRHRVCGGKEIWGNRSSPHYDIHCTVFAHTRGSRTHSITVNIREHVPVCVSQPGPRGCLGISENFSAFLKTNKKTKI